MKYKEFQKWKSLTAKMLDDGWRFRKLCGKPFDRGFIGELLVLNQLLDTYKSKFTSAIDNDIVYAGSSNREWDITLKLNRQEFKINAKATTVISNDEPRWVRQNAKTFCDVKIDKKSSRQNVGRKASNDANLFYVFVDVGMWLKTHTVQFFTVSDKKAKQVFYKKYRRLYHGKVRKSKSTDFWVEYEDVKSFKDQGLKNLLK